MDYYERYTPESEARFDYDNNNNNQLAATATATHHANSAPVTAVTAERAAVAQALAGSSLAQGTGLGLPSINEAEESFWNCPTSDCIEDPFEYRCPSDESDDNDESGGESGVEQTIYSHNLAMEAAAAREHVGIRESRSQPRAMPMTRSYAPEAVEERIKRAWNDPARYNKIWQSLVKSRSSGIAEAEKSTHPEAADASSVDSSRNEVALSHRHSTASGSGKDSASASGKGGCKANKERKREGKPFDLGWISIVSSNGLLVPHETGSTTRVLGQHEHERRGHSGHRGPSPAGETGSSVWFSAPAASGRMDSVGHPDALIKLENFDPSPSFTTVVPRQFSAVQAKTFILSHIDSWSESLRHDFAVLSPRKSRRNDNKSEGTESQSSQSSSKPNPDTTRVRRTSKDIRPYVSRAMCTSIACVLDEVSPHTDWPTLWNNESFAMTLWRGTEVLLQNVAACKGSGLVTADSVGL